jgi:hypothetical protein
MYRTQIFTVNVNLNDILQNQWQVPDPRGKSRFLGASYTRKRQPVLR